MTLTYDIAMLRDTNIVMCHIKDLTRDNKKFCNTWHCFVIWHWYWHYHMSHQRPHTWQQFFFL